MPKYLVEMHDGRKFQVEADSQPSEAEVLTHLGAQPSGPKTVSPDEPGTFMGGAAQSIRDTVAKTGRGILEGLNPLPVLKGIWDNSTDNLPYQPNDTPATAAARLKAHDTPAGGPSMLESAKGLSDPETGGRAIGNLGQAFLTGKLISAAQNPAARVVAGKALGAVGDFDFTHPLKSTVGKVADALQRSGEPAVAPPSVEVPKPSAPLSDLDLARQEVAAGRLPQSVLGRLEQGQQGPPKTPPGMIRGSLRPITPERPPMTVAPESPLQPPSPMQQPRVNVGAEVVGRQNGLSKEAVRQQTGPLFNEAPGAASPVVPQTPFERMHDKLLKMGHGNPERESYVQAAKDPKTAGQLEIMRRTLERNGLSVAAATSMAEVLRREVMKRLSGGQSQ